MEIIRYKTGDIIIMKKPHPCGDKRFIVLRVGSDIRIRCLTCGRDMTMERLKLEKITRKIELEGDSHAE